MELDEVTNFKKHGRLLDTAQAQALRILTRKELKKNLEFKYHDKSGSVSVSSSSMIDLTLISQGYTGQTRRGDKIRIKSLWYCYSMVSGNDLYQYGVRFILFQWFSDDIDPVIADILKDYLVRPYVSSYNYEKSGKYRILLDKSYSLYFDGISSNVDKGILLEPCFLDSFVCFKSGGTTGANKLYLLLVSNSVAPDPLPSVYYYIRLNFTDA